MWFLAAKNRLYFSGMDTALQAVLVIFAYTLKTCQEKSLLWEVRALWTEVTTQIIPSEISSLNQQNYFWILLS